MSAAEHCPKCGLRSLIALGDGGIGCLSCSWQQEGPSVRRPARLRCEACDWLADELFQAVNPATGKRQAVCDGCAEAWSAIWEKTREARTG